jgi:hypothetical protein
MDEISMRLRRLGIVGLIRLRRLDAAQLVDHFADSLGADGPLAIM